MTFDFLIEGSTKGNIDKLDTATDCHNWFILTKRFLQECQFKFVTDQIVIIAFDGLFLSIKLRMNILASCQNEFVNHFHIITYN
ncbi:Uncharacterised protein [Streptococcus pneumoniae]|nr:Uncharacterised protein [Streptococcus pneumoniae]